MSKRGLVDTLCVVDEDFPLFVQPQQFVGAGRRSRSAGLRYFLFIEDLPALSGWASQPRT